MPVPYSYHFSKATLDKLPPVQLAPESEWPYCPRSRPWTRKGKPPLTLLCSHLSLQTKALTGPSQMSGSVVKIAKSAMQDLLFHSAYPQEGGKEVLCPLKGI